MDNWFKRWLLIGECLLALGSAYGQADFKPTHSINGSIAFDYGYLKDLSFSPLNYQEQGKTYSIAYQWQNARRLDQFHFRTDYGKGNLQTKAADAFTTDYIRANLSLGYLRKFSVTPAHKTSWLMGARYHFYLNYLDWNEQDAFSFFAHHSLDLSIAMSHRFRAKHQLSAKLHVPIWSLIIRPPYNGTNEELEVNSDSNHLALLTNGSGSSLERLISFDFKTTYQYQLNKRWGLQIAYQARYQNLSDKQKLIHLQHQLSAGLQLKF